MTNILWQKDSMVKNSMTTKFHGQAFHSPNLSWQKGFHDKTFYHTKISWQKKSTVKHLMKKKMLAKHFTWQTFHNNESEPSISETNRLNNDTWTVCTLPSRRGQIEVIRLFTARGRLYCCSVSNKMSVRFLKARLMRKGLILGAG